MSEGPAEIPIPYFKIKCLFTKYFCVPVIPLACTLHVCTRATAGFTTEIMAPVSTMNKNLSPPIYTVSKGSVTNPFVADGTLQHVFSSFS
jgi:hypothetical protein